MTDSRATSRNERTGTTATRRHRHLGCAAAHHAALGVVLLCSLVLPAASRAQITWLNYEDGDILNVSTATGLAPGRFRIDATRALEESQDHGKILQHHFVFLYGLTPYVTLGASTRHLDQQNGDLFKNGLGDSNLFVKAHWQPEDSPLSFALRQSLTLPTGYELEREGLVPFTTRHNDYAAQGIVSYRTHRLGIHLNPGVIVTGGDNPTYLTVGTALELDRFVPLGLSFAGEYFTRWNMVAEEFESDVFVRFHRPLLWGLAADFGVKRRLLESATTQAEWRLGLSLGRVHDPEADNRYLPPPKFPPVRLHVEPIGSDIPDPTGVADLLLRELQGAGHLQAHGVPVLIRAEGGAAASEDGAVDHGGYRLRLRILGLEDGRIGGFRVPLLFQAPRAEARLHVLVGLLDQNGLPLGREVVFDTKASQGLGATLAPMTTSYEQRIVPDEVRARLVREVVEKMARDIAEVNAEVIGERESR